MMMTAIWSIRTAVVIRRREGLRLDGTAREGSKLHVSCVLRS